MTHGQARELRALDDEMLATRRREAYTKLEEDAYAGRGFDLDLASMAGAIWEEQERRAALSAHARLTEHAWRRSLEGC